MHTMLLAVISLSCLVVHADGASSSSHQALCAALEPCQPLAAREASQLLKEARWYETSRKYQVKIEEARGTRVPGQQHFGILAFLRQHVLDKGQSVLDLGCAAGAMLRQLRAVYNSEFGGPGPLAGVELVPGWARAGAEIFGNSSDSMSFFQGDVTAVRLGRTFDLITMNDVLEHVMPKRYGCLFATLAAHSRPNTMVYMHTPTPETQLSDKGQFFENVVPHHILVAGMACAGFQLERFAHDTETNCTNTPPKKRSAARHGLAHRRGAGCIDGASGVAKYSHAVFRWAPAGTLGSNDRV